MMLCIISRYAVSFQDAKRHFIHRKVAIHCVLPHAEILRFAQNDKKKERTPNNFHPHPILVRTKENRRRPKPAAALRLN